eukprot:TRINITY_DN1527_c0_g1_i6.p1 TRINITY_DN1527_c0_g1~~TRINITY_DN1527_c0_g1_i6.p1  ORF type:complete len:1174 (-),score=199.90 TRINITY_DN1527_c0_g1_i6:216-3680(-)
MKKRKAEVVNSQPKIPKLTKQKRHPWAQDFLKSTLSDIHHDIFQYTNDDGFADMLRLHSSEPLFEFAQKEKKHQGPNLLGKCPCRYTAGGCTITKGKDTVVTLNYVDESCPSVLLSYNRNLDAAETLPFALLPLNKTQASKVVLCERFTYNSDAGCWQPNGTWVRDNSGVLSPVCDDSGVLSPSQPDSIVLRLFESRSDSDAGPVSPLPDPTDADLMNGMMNITDLLQVGDAPLPYTQMPPQPAPQSSLSDPIDADRLDDLLRSFAASQHSEVPIHDLAPRPIAQPSPSDQTYEHVMEIIRRNGAASHVTDEPVPDTQVQRPPAPAVANVRCPKFGVPQVNSKNWIPRETAVSQVVERLVSADATTVAAVGVAGMGGIGKTTLCVLVARDPRIAAAFPDGVFWVTLGEKCDDARMRGVQKELASYLGLDSKQFVTWERGVQLLKEAFEGKRVLLIFDDVWKRELLQELQVVDHTAGARILVSTRNKGVVDDCVSVDVLSESEAYAMLARHSAWPLEKLQCDVFSTALQPLLKRCGGLVLAVAMVGATLRQYEPAVQWIDYVSEQFASSDGLCCDDLVDYEKHRSVYDAIAVSLNMLDDKIPAHKFAKEHYHDLAVFGENEEIRFKDSTGTYVCLQTMWVRPGVSKGTVAAALALLVQRCLLTEVKEGVYELHCILFAYLDAKTQDDKVRDDIALRAMGADSNDCPFETVMRVNMLEAALAAGVYLPDFTWYAVCDKTGSRWPQRVDCMKWLFEHGYGCATVDWRGRSEHPLCYVKSPVILKELLSLNPSLLEDAAQEVPDILHYVQLVEVAEGLLAANADLLHTPATDAVSKGNTPLHSACFGFGKIVRLLLESGALVDETNADGETPLFKAILWRVEAKARAIVELLLQYQCSVNIANNDGVTPLMTAARRGHAGIFELLLKHGANPHGKDKAGNGVWHHAVSLRHFNESHAVRLLDTIRKLGDVDINAVNRRGQTPLLVASSKIQLEAVVTGLINCGADVNARDAQGATPLHHVAHFSGNVAVAKMLVDKGADVNAVCHDEYDREVTCGVFAVGTEHTAFLQYLLSLPQFDSNHLKTALLELEDFPSHHADEETDEEDAEFFKEHSPIMLVPRDIEWAFGNRFGDEIRDVLQGKGFICERDPKAPSKWRVVG